MDFLLSAYFAAFVLGAVHAIEVDHMVAVSVFAGLKPKMAAAANYGARWGLGHAAMVVLVGGLIAWLDISIADKWQRYSEIVVGLALILLGFWAVRAAQKFHLHTPIEHDHHQHSHSDHLHGHLHAHAGSVPHQHTHQHDPKKHHQHLPTAMGALHGLAGSTPVLALIPVTLLDEFQHALIYLILFSVGTTLSMTLYAVLAAAAVQGLGLTQLKIKYVTYAIATVTIGVGGWWVFAAL